jgi:hypothetical protein
VFAVGEFRVLLGGLLAFVLGFEFEILGLSVLVYARTGSGFLAAVAFGAGFLPQALGGALLTSLADRLPPRAVIASGLLARAVPGLAIGLLPGLPVAAMLALVALCAVPTPVFLAAASGLLPDVLHGDGYVLGRSVFGMTGSGTQIVGLGIGGGVLAVLPVRWLLLMAGCSLVAATAIMRLGLRPRAARAGHAGRSGGRAAGPGAWRGAVRATLAGHAELLTAPRVRGLLLAQWLPLWFGTGAEALIVPYAASLGHPASAAGPLLAAVPTGMLLGNVVVGRCCSPSARERLALPLALTIGAPLLALAFRPPLPLAGVVLLVSGFGYAYSLGIQRAFLDSVPERLRGQGFGLSATGAMGGQGLLPPAVGGIAAALGPAVAMAVSGGAVLAAALALRRTLWTARYGGQRTIPG